MPFLVPPVTDERDGLLKFLAAQRAALRASLHGLNHEQATSKPSVSDLSLAGLLKHSCHCERSWTVVHLARRELSPREYGEDFVLNDGETIEDVLALQDEVARDTEEIARALPDLDVPVPVPRGAPWFPKDVDFWSARWVLLHLIEELARHAGHADIVRESIDGSNAYALLAKAENVDAPWLEATLEGR